MSDPTAPWGGMGSREAYMAWKAEQEKKQAEEEKKQPAATPKADAEKDEDVTKSGQKPRALDARKALAGGGLPEPARAAPLRAGVVAPPKPDLLPPLPRPPSDLSRWQERDFFMAKLLEKPELLEVIARRAVDGRDDEEIVRILTRLLQPECYAGLRELVIGEAPAPQTGRAAAGRRIGSAPRSRGETPYWQKLIEATVDALAQNTTSAANRTLAQLIMGQLATDDDVAAATAALESLAAHPTSAHEEMLLRVATEAEQLVAEESALPPQAASQQAVALIHESGSSAIRLRIAEYLSRNDPPLQLRRALEGLLRDLSPENLEAHLALYMGSGDPAPTRKVLASHFTALSSNAVNGLLGSNPQDDSDQVAWNRRAAQLLWANNFGLVVEGRLNRLNSWTEEPELLSLALSLPTDAMRAAVATRLEHQWDQGPNVDASRLISEEMVVEPGVLVLLRAILEQRADSRKSSSLVSLRSQRSARGRSGRSDPVAMQQHQQWGIHDAWARLAGDLAADWCARCRTAAHDRDGAERARGRKVDWSKGLEDLAVEPHSTEAITASHRAVLPMDISAGKRDSDFDPMRADYVRIEERTRPSRLLAYYDRGLPGHQRRDIDSGTCYEGLVAAEEPDVLQSVDVRITRASDVRRLPEEEQDLVVEILAVKIRNPGIVLDEN